MTNDEKIAAEVQEQLDSYPAERGPAPHGLPVGGRVLPQSPAGLSSAELEALAAAAREREEREEAERRKRHAEEERKERATQEVTTGFIGTLDQLASRALTATTLGVLETLAGEIEDAVGQAQREADAIGGTEAAAEILSRFRIHRAARLMPLLDMLRDKPPREPGRLKDTN